MRIFNNMDYSTVLSGIILVAIGIIIIGVATNNGSKVTTKCNHQIYSNCNSYQIQCNEGSEMRFINIHGYNLENGCVEIQEGEICYNCDRIYKFRKRKFCGDFNIREYQFCR